MNARTLASCSVLIVACLALGGCESCTERFFPPPPQSSGPPAYELGLIPAALRRSLYWPARPRVEEQVTLTSPPNGAWTQSGVRLSIATQLEQLVIDADDVEVVGSQGAHVGTIVIAPGHRRIRIEGGSYGQIVLEPPTMLLEPPPEWRAEDMIEDVLIEDVRVDAVAAGLSGVLLRGRRIAIVNSRVDAQFHAVLAGDTAPIPSEDVIVAGCSLWSAGDESTLVLRDVRRAVVVDSWIENERVFGLRVHGESDWVVARSNTLVGAGAAFATEERDDLDHTWFWLSTMHHTTGELFELMPDRIDTLVIAHNRVYSGTATCDWCGPTPESWLVERNHIRAYAAPPPRP